MYVPYIVGTMYLCLLIKFESVQPTLFYIPALAADAYSYGKSNKADKID